MRLKARTIRDLFINFVLISLLLGAVFVPLYKQKVVQVLKQTGLMDPEIALKKSFIFEYFFQKL